MHADDDATPSVQEVTDKCWCAIANFIFATWEVQRTKQPRNPKLNITGNELYDGLVDVCHHVAVHALGLPRKAWLLVMNNGASPTWDEAACKHSPAMRQAMEADPDFVPHVPCPLNSTEFETAAARFVNYPPTCGE